MIYCETKVDPSDLEGLIDEYECKKIKTEKKGKFIYYNLIVSEDFILAFLSELPYDYIIKYIFDDVLHQMNIQQNKKNNIDIYRHYRYDRKPFYKLIMTETDNEIYSLCRYLEKYN